MSIDAIMGCVLTEMLEEDDMNTSNGGRIPKDNSLLPIKYDLELIKNPDGSYEWKE